MEYNRLTALKETLETPKNIVIIPHQNPDGDALGSTIALQQILASSGHKSVVISPNDYPDFLKWLPYQDKVVRFDSEKEKAVRLIENADLIFTLDFNALSRAGDLRPLLEKVKKPFVMIDHHQQPDDYAEYTFSNPKASSTCELVYDFIVRLGQKDQINAEIATCLYTGIMTDTGSFRFSSTGSHTHRVVADLIDRGAVNSEIHQNVFDSSTQNQLQLLGVALANLKIIEELNTAYITLSQEELDLYYFTKGDTEGFVNYGLSIKGIIFAAIFIEHRAEGIIKISLRSKGDFDVNKVAREHFHGGGHINAAGGRSHKSLKETAAHFEKFLPEYKEQLQKK